MIEQPVCLSESADEYNSTRHHDCHFSRSLRGEVFPLGFPEPRSTIIAYIQDIQSSGTLAKELAYQMNFEAINSRHSQVPCLHLSLIRCSNRNVFVLFISMKIGRIIFSLCGMYSIFFCIKGMVCLTGHGRAFFFFLRESQNQNS